MNNDILNTLVLAVLLAVVAGFGVYTTQKKQPEELTELENKEQALRLAQAEIDELLVQEAQSKAEADAAIRRWNARYKVLPSDLSSPQVVEYLNALTAAGFRTFDLSLSGIAPGAQYSIYTYRATGQAYFDALYRFVWTLENGRALYRVNDLRLESLVSVEPGRGDDDRPRQRVLVDFSMEIEAYFGGSEGMSAPDSVVAVPDDVLPDRSPVINPFDPLIYAELPPNADDLVDIENDPLVSLVGGAAVFKHGEETRALREGDRVYLGRITRIDPASASVTASLNKGGIREQIEVDLATGERYRQAFGTGQLTPDYGSGPLAPPPAPGTPEARRAGQ